MSKKDDFMKKLMGAIKGAAEADDLDRTVDSDRVTLVADYVGVSVAVADTIQTINKSNDVSVGMGLAPCGCHVMMLKLGGSEHEHERAFHWEEAIEFADTMRRSIGMLDPDLPKGNQDAMANLIMTSSVMSAVLMARKAIGLGHGEIFDEQIAVAKAAGAYFDKLVVERDGDSASEQGAVIKKGDPRFNKVAEFVTKALEQVVPKARAYTKAHGMVTDVASVKPGHVKHMADAMVQYAKTSGRGMGVMYVLDDGVITIDPSTGEQWGKVIGVVFTSMKLEGDADILVVSSFDHGLAKVVADAEQKIVDDGKFDKAMNSSLGTIRRFADLIKDGKPKTPEGFNKIFMEAASVDGNILPVDASDLAKAVKPMVGTVH